VIDTELLWQIQGYKNEQIRICDTIPPAGPALLLTSTIW